MSLTSYRAAPPRVTKCVSLGLQRHCSFKCKRPLKAALAAERRTIEKRRLKHALCRPGSDLLSRVLRRSTISAGAFHGRVRNGIGCSHPAITTRSAKGMFFREADFLITERSSASATARRRPPGALAEHRPEGPLMREREKMGIGK